MQFLAFLNEIGLDPTSSTEDKLQQKVSTKALLKKIHLNILQHFRSLPPECLNEYTGYSSSESSDPKARPSPIDIATKIMQS
jgi:hypothetical protein